MQFSVLEINLDTSEVAQTKTNVRMQSARLQETKHDFLRDTPVEGQSKSALTNDAEFGI